MLFNDISTWSKSKLRMVRAVSYILYALAVLIVPIFIIAIRYQVFHATNYKLTGWGIICLMIVFFVGYGLINRLVNKMPQITLNQQRVKFTIQLILKCIVPVGLIIIACLIKDDMEKAIDTMILICTSYVIGIGIDYLAIQYLEEEVDLRAKALEQKEIDKRK